MLIAGSQQPIVLPEGFMRVHGIAFNPEPGDKQIFFRPPRNWNGYTLESVRRVAAEGAKWALRETPLNMAEENMLTLNWGTGGNAMGRGPILNKWAAVQCSSNQTACLRALGDLAPLTWNNWLDVNTWPMVVKRNHGSHGRGKQYVENPGRRMFGYDVYQQFIRNRTEWRIHVFKDKIIGAMRKIPAEGTAPTNCRVDWHFKRVQVIPKPVAAFAIEAAKRVGLDFAGVDVIKDEDTGRFYVLETNSAPGMDPETVKRLYMHIQREFAN